MNRKILSYIVIFGFLPYPVFSWDLAKNEEGIQIYTRFTSESNLKEFRAEMIVDVPIEKFISILEDISTYPTWMHNCKEAKVLKTINKNERITYLMNETNWITKRRDMVVYSKITKSHNEVKISLNGKPDFIPLHEDHIRVPKVQGFWKFNALKGGRTKATYQLILEPGGSIPDWISNSTVVDTPFNTMKNLRILAKK